MFVYARILFGCLWGHRMICVGFIGSGSGLGVYDAGGVGSIYGGMVASDFWVGVLGSCLGSLYIWRVVG